MDTRIALLKEFYSTRQKDKLKLETNCYGFEFLDSLLSDGVMLEYGELSDRLIHKYKLMNVAGSRVDELLKGHINKEYNVCLYFDEQANNIFSFNLDNNLKENDTELTPEMKFSVDCLMEHLIDLAIEPFVTVSGRGYHVWCRLDEPIDNKILYGFMMKMAARTMESLHKNGYDYNRVKFNMYPNNEIVNIVSLRFFGSEHIKNKVFSYVYTKNGTLDEIDSWIYFAEYMRNKTISKDQFIESSDKLARYFGEPNSR
jgi:hypothetical protein